MQQSGHEEYDRHVQLWRRLDQTRRGQTYNDGARCNEDT